MNVYLYCHKVDQYFNEVSATVRLMINDKEVDVNRKGNLKLIQKIKKSLVGEHIESDIYLNS